MVRQSFELAPEQLQLHGGEYAGIAFLDRDEAEPAAAAVTGEGAGERAASIQERCVPRELDHDPPRLLGGQRPSQDLGALVLGEEGG